MKARYPRISAPTLGFVLATMIVATGCPDADPEPDGGAEVAQDGGAELEEVGPQPDTDIGAEIDAKEVEISDDAETIDDAEVGPDADVDEVDEDADETTDTVDGETTDPDADETTDTEDGETTDTADGETADDADATDDDSSDGDVEVEAEVQQGCITDEDCAAQNTNTCVTSTCDHATGECLDTPLEDGIACEDGNLCSTGETCTAGACIGGSAITCDDANPCTDDLCKPAEGCTFNNNFSQCDDGDPCTEGDACLGGECKTGGVKCDDGNPCTADNCDALGECSFPPTDGIACDDGSECTGGETCSAGACVAAVPDACDDGNPCTNNSCSPDGTTCVTTSASGSPCDDGDICTTNDLCVGSNCTGGATEPCDDGDDCTATECDPTSGCTFAIVDGAPCQDGDACTDGDVCDAAGACVPGADLACDDDNVCTADSCDPATGCVNANIDASCDDGDACTTNETCVEGTCEVEAVECDDDNACTDDQCDTLLGCQYIDTSGSCDDGDACTDDSCDPSMGCVATPNTAPCDDGDPCTDNDACGDGVCAGAALDCDDDDDCTLDVCTVEEGCVNAPFTGACDDGDACTEAEACEADGLCDGGTPVSLDDGVACTVDACDSDDGVTHTPDDGMCGTGFVCDAEEDCVWGGVVLLIERVMLDPTADDDSVDGQGQWFVVRNIGSATADMANFVVTNDEGETAAVVGVDGTSEVLLAPGESLALVKAPENLPAEVPAGAGAVYGVFGDGFGWLDTGDLVGIESTDGVLVETVSFEDIATTGAVTATQMPVVQGRFTDLDGAVAMAAATDADNSLNDAAASWCVGGSMPGASATDCGRAVVNEVALVGDDGARWIEVWAAAGANVDGLLLRLVAADGAVVGLVPVAGGRMPVDALRVVLDGTDGVLLPTLTSGAVQLLRDSVLVDVVGFGDLTAAVDAQLSLPMFEGTAAMAPATDETLGRAAGGVDTDDNSADFTSGAASQGVANP